MHTEGVEKCTRALDTVVQLPEAKGLLGEALQRFRDVTCIGLCNWANVHLCLAKKLIEHAAANGTKLADVRADFDEHIASTVQRYKEALSYNGVPLLATFACRSCGAARGSALTARGVQASTWRRCLGWGRPTSRWRGRMRAS